MDSRAQSAATLGVLAMLCVFGILFGVKAVTSDLPTDPIVEGPPPSCEMRLIEAGTKVRPKDVTVSVFNAGQTSGLASKTMSQLLARGFSAGESDNAPRSADVKRVQLWADDPTNPAVQLVARQFGPDVKIFEGKRVLGVGVVVVVGDEFHRLSEVSSQQVIASNRTEICSPPIVAS